VSIQAPANQDSVLGYVLKERIGAGGYGEVWSAEAPGGIAKAIKFIFGVHDGNRAQVELNALDKIKQVRHPFLLSLDRIEVIDGRLVVITELAEGSLADIYSKYIAEDKPGIPRDELLTYVRDAADALDFISQVHSLQHLDIKPENLLVVGGHVKVADFGLVKNIHNMTQSLMNGLTPTYAPPELFDGKPSALSDQYSLAIVYQEMLTGVRPFTGTTPAQLAAQHMKGKPDLNPLPRGDQHVIKRALSKNPESRFASCREMVDELTNRISRRPKTRRGLLRRDDEDNNTVELQSDSSSPDVTNQLSGGLPIQKTVVRNLPAFKLDCETAKTRPTLVVGIGKTGTNVARLLRSMLNQRIGTRDQLPSLRFLCVDSDRQSLAQAVCSIQGDKLTSDEVVEIPLRNSQDYRENNNRFSTWLSRRWIYNIPRSLQSEGLRPLGRLAFVDHSEDVFNRLQEAVVEMTKPEAVSTTASTLNMDPQPQPRVLIVTSIAGGIGSGSVLDVAYATRTVLSDLGIRDARVDCILTHSTARVMGNNDLNIANTFACLAELQHFIEYGYPGDESCGLPEFDDEIPFDNAYVVDLGKQLTPKAYNSAIQELAEYTFLDLATSSQVFFEMCRELDMEGENEFGLKSFGLKSTGLSSFEQFADELDQCLIKKWTRNDAKEKDLAAEHSTKPAVAEQLYSELVEQFKLDGPRQHQQRTAEIKKLVAGQRSGIISGLIHSLASGATGPDNSFTSVSDSFQKLKENCGGQSIQQHMELIIVEEFDNHATKLQQTVESSIDNPKYRVGNTAAVVARLLSKVLSIIEWMQTSSGTLSNSLNQSMTAIQHMAGGKRIDANELNVEIERYFDLGIEQCAIEASEKLCRYWKSELSKIEAELLDYKQSAILIGRIPTDPKDGISSLSMRANDENKNVIEENLQKFIHSKMPEMTDELDRRVDQCVLKPHGGFCACLDIESVVNRELPNHIRILARRILAEKLNSIDFEKDLVDESLSKQKIIELFCQQAQQSHPIINNCGGDTNMLIAYPCRSESEFDPVAFSQVTGAEPNLIPSTCGLFTTCFEYKNIPISNFAFRLLEQSPECIELVKRIHTRTDVDWISISKILS
jgi:serine/threonine protein kinase